jgi:hypothetical protein
MDLFNKLQDIRSSTNYIPDDIEERLKVIESRYTYSPVISITVDPEVLQELDDISRELMENQNILFLRDSIRKQVQVLSRLPVPQPPHFNREAFNQFVCQDSRDIVNKANVSEEKEVLLNLLESLELQKLEFLSDPYREQYIYHLQHLTNILPTATPDNKVIITNTINRIKTLDVSLEELEFYKQKLGTDNTTISPQDFSILEAICETGNSDIFKKVAQLMGIKDDECCQLIMDTLLIQKRKQSNIDKLKSHKIVIPSF